MKKLNQAQIAQRLGISKSYLSMILSGQRKCPPELMDKLSSLGIVNNYIQSMLPKQDVVGSNPITRSIR